MAAEIKKVWLYVEDVIIKSNYERIGGKALCDFLPGRTVAAIQRRAHILGVKHRTVTQRTGYPWPKDTLAATWNAWKCGQPAQLRPSL